MRCLCYNHFLVISTITYTYIFTMCVCVCDSDNEQSGDGIYGCRSHNAKLFERIEHSGIR